MLEKEIEISTNNAKLFGTLCLPDESGPFPVVLMVHGSGDIDRNENTKTQKLNIFNTIAHSLANDGVASFRYDKRGIGSSTGDFYTTGHFQLVEDAARCLEYLFENQQCDCNSVFLLGHSEGTVIVPRLSQRYDKVAGIILIAPFVDNLESIMMKQANTIKLAARELTGFKKIYINLFLFLFDPVKAQTKVIKKIKSTSKTTIYSMFQKIPAKWLRELISLDPPEIYSSVTCSSLIVGGSKDIQCEPGDVKIIRELVKGSVESHIIENMSHILRLESGKPSMFNYPDLIKKPIDSNVLGLIGSWVNREASRTSSS